MKLNGAQGAMAKSFLDALGLSGKKNGH